MSKPLRLLLAGLKDLIVQLSQQINRAAQADNLQYRLSLRLGSSATGRLALSVRRHAVDISVARLNIGAGQMREVAGIRFALLGFRREALPACWAQDFGGRASDPGSALSGATGIVLNADLAFRAHTFA